MSVRSPQRRRFEYLCCAMFDLNEHAMEKTVAFPRHPVTATTSPIQAVAYDAHPTAQGRSVATGQRLSSGQ